VIPIRWRRRLANERGLTLVELLVVTVLFGVIVAAITTLFVQATNAEADLNNRFQAQLSARVALDRLRREVHCASSVTPAGPASTITLTLPTYCKAGTGPSTWCAIPYNGSTTRFRLWRSAADPCGDAVDRLYADFLTTATVFNYIVQSSASLGKVHVELPVDLDPAKPGSYTLTDDLVLRNSARLCITGSPSPPC
jgi:prepilin-type N-terminal cleavage/methylation domain-containing protein